MENKINIAMFSDSFYPIVGGRENVIHNLATSLSQRTKFFLLTTTFKGHKTFIPDEKLPYEVYRCKSLRLTKNEYLSIIDRKTKKMIIEKIKNNEIDIIHTQTKYALTKYALSLKKKFGIPVITSCHTNYLEQYKHQLKCPLLYKPFLRYVIKTINKTDGVITVSNFMKNELLSMGVKKPITVIPNGNDILDYQITASEIEALKTKINLQTTENIFIFVGRITETKNLSFLLKSLKILKEKSVDFKMIFVGNGEIEKYKKLVKSLSLEDNCIFTGKITDRKKIATLYSLSTLNLYPSVGESFGLTIREAGAMGTPSVTIYDTATSEDIIDGKNGYTSSLNEKDFANKIIEILNNHNNLAQVKQNAKEFFTTTWDSVAEQHLNEYKKYIKQP